MKTIVGLSAVVGGAATTYKRGFVRMPRNVSIDSELTTDEMRFSAPAKLDWSTRGATTPVKHQGQCGSCWAYSTTETIESALFMGSGSLTMLSEQNIISCDKTDNGCNGGDLPTAFGFVEKNGGIELEKNYPETSWKTGRTGHCHEHKKELAVKVTSWKFAIPECPENDNPCSNQKESDLMPQLAVNGPLAICVNAEEWDGYNGGIWTKPCPGGWYDLDHCVQLVGYDNSVPTPYWKVRNSWGPDWGEGGFIRIAMGKNLCGVASEAVAAKATLISNDVLV